MTPRGTRSLEDVRTYQRDLMRRNRERLRRLQKHDIGVNETSVTEPVHFGPELPPSIRSTIPWWTVLSSQRPPECTRIWENPCRWCGCQRLLGETPGWCCRQGKNILEPLQPYPNEVMQIFERDPKLTSDISRKLNRLFCFSGSGVEGRFANLPVPSNVAISGRIYHQIYDVASGQHSMRWFIYDEQERLTTARQNGVPFQYVNSMRWYLEHINPFIHHLRAAMSASNSLNQSFAVELKDPGANGEVAAIIHSNNLTEISPRSVVIWHCSGSTARPISILSPYYEPLQYPLFFPHGTPGWCPSSPMSQIWWYRARILVEPRFQLHGRLFNEYLVDMFSRVEDERLSFIRRGREQHLSMLRTRINEQNQEQIDLGVDVPVNDANCTVAETGMILPASFLGSRAWASQQVADALAICREKGNPSLFITITTNPNWPEITSQLRPGQSASDIPHVVCRVFHSRVAYAMKIIKQRFGKVVYVIKVIEFQKRGLPHCHMILKVSSLNCWRINRDS